MQFICKLPALNVREVIGDHKPKACNIQFPRAENFRNHILNEHKLARSPDDWLKAPVKWIVIVLPVMSMLASYAIVIGYQPSFTQTIQIFFLESQVTFSFAVLYIGG
jgi:hypothetical protein